MRRSELHQEPHGVSTRGVFDVHVAAEDHRERASERASERARDKQHEEQGVTVCLMSMSPPKTPQPHLPVARMAEQRATGC
eukprot:1021096-Rhodomonas_salina.1